MDKENTSPVKAMDRKRRSSILKPVKYPSTEVDQLDETEKQTRKVRFSSNFVKPFTTEENTTIWDRTYEEPIEKSEDTPSYVINMSEGTVSDTTTQKHNQTCRDDFPLLVDLLCDSFENRQTVLNISDYYAEERGNANITKSGKKNTTCIPEALVQTLATKDLCGNVTDKVESAKSVCLSKTILDLTEMEFTQTIPTSEIHERLPAHVQQINEQQFPSERRKTILSCVDMELTEIVPNFSPISSHTGRRTILSSVDMDLTRPLAGLSPPGLSTEDDEDVFEHANKTNLMIVDMECTEPVCHLSEDVRTTILEKVTDENSRIYHQPFPSRGRTIFSNAETELTDFPSEDAFIQQKPEKRKTILMPIDMELTEPVCHLSEDVRTNILEKVTDENSRIHHQPSPSRGRTIFSNAETELTDFPSEDAFIQQKPEKRKTILMPIDMELTEPVCHLSEDVRTTILEKVTDENSRIYHQPFPSRGRKIFSNAETEHTELLPDFSSEDAFIQQKPEKRKTILMPIDMELTKPVCHLSEDVRTNILEKVTDENSRIHHQPFPSRGRTIFSNAETALTELIPDFPSEDAFIQQKPEKRKTILMPIDMELTEPVCHLSEDVRTNILEKVTDENSRIHHQPSPSRGRTIFSNAETELTDFPSEDTFNQQKPEKRKTILMPIDMELTEPVCHLSEDVRTNILEKVTDENSRIHHQPFPSRGRAIFSNAETELTELLPDFPSEDAFIQQKPEKRKTILMPIDMELTEPVCHLSEVATEIISVKFDKHAQISISKGDEYAEVATPNVSLSSFPPETSAYSPCVDDTQALIHYNLSGKKSAKSSFSKILAGDYHDVSLPHVHHFQLGLPSNSFKIFSDDSAVESLAQKEPSINTTNISVHQTRNLTNPTMLSADDTIPKISINRLKSESYPQNTNGTIDKLIGMSNENPLLGKDKISKITIERPDPENLTNVTMSDANDTIPKISINRLEPESYPQNTNGTLNNLIGTSNENPLLDKVNSPKITTERSDPENLTNLTMSGANDTIPKISIIGLEPESYPQNTNRTLNNLIGMSNENPLLGKDKIPKITIERPDPENLTNVTMSDANDTIPKISINRLEPESHLQNTSQTLNNLIGISNGTTHNLLLHDTSIALLNDDSNDISEPERIPLDYSKMSDEELLQHVPDGWDVDLIGEALLGTSATEVLNQFWKDSEELQAKRSNFKILYKNFFKQVEEIMNLEVHDKPTTALEAAIVGVSDHDREIKSIEETVRDQAKLCEDEYKIISFENDVYTITTLFNTIKLIVTIDSGDRGLVLKMKVFSRISDEAETVVKYINSLFMRRLEDAHIRSSVGEKYTVLTLLDYIQINFRNLDEFDTDLELLQRKYGIAVQRDFKVVYVGASHRLKVAVEVIIDCPDYNKVDDSCISLNFLVGHFDEMKIRTLSNNCPKGLSFLKCFIEQLDLFFSNK